MILQKSLKWQLLAFMNKITVKVLINFQAFIRIISFHGEGDGRLLEARVLTPEQPKTLLFVFYDRHLD